MDQENIAHFRNSRDRDNTYPYMWFSTFTNGLLPAGAGGYMNQYGSTMEEEEEEILVGQLAGVLEQRKGNESTPIIHLLSC